jgi:hypothetical protein
MDTTVRERWCKLACIIRVTRERTVMSSGHTSRETAYWISSHPKADAGLLARFIRSQSSRHAYIVVPPERMEIPT